jgi:hypothetical protein
LDKFEVGEVAIFVNPESPRHLEDCTIVGGLQVGQIIDESSMSPLKLNAMVYAVTFASDGDDIRRFAEPHQLRKKPPPEVPPESKREQLGSWDAIGFRPKVEEVER